MRAFFRHKLVANSLISMSGTLLAGGLGYLFHFWISKKMEVIQYGELQTLLAFFAILSVCSSSITYIVLPLRSVLEHQPEHNISWLSMYRSIYHKTIRFASWLILFLLLLSPLLVFYFHFGDAAGLWAVAGATFFTILIGIDKGFLLASRRFAEVSIVNTVTAAIKLLVGVALVYLVGTASAVAYSLIFSAFLAWWLAIILLKKTAVSGGTEPAETSEENPLPFSFNILAGPNAKVWIFSSLLLFVTNIDVLLVKSLAASEFAGYYAALSLLGKLVFWLNSAVILVMLPESVSQTQAHRKMNRSTLLFAYGTIVGISGCMILLYLFFPVQIISLLFTIQYVSYADTLWLFGLGALFLSLFNLEANFAFARRDFWVSGICAGLIVALFGIFHVLTFSMFSIAGVLAIVFAGGFLLMLARRLWKT